MIKGIKFASVPVRDQDRALQFYTETLRMKVATDQPFDDRQRWIELRFPGADTRLVLFTPEGHEDRIGTFSNITFVGDDVRKTWQELRERGVRQRAHAQNRRPFVWLQGVKIAGYQRWRARQLDGAEISLIQGGDLTRPQPFRDRHHDGVGDPEPERRVAAR